MVKNCIREVSPHINIRMLQAPTQYSMHSCTGRVQMQTVYVMCACVYVIYACVYVVCACVYVMSACIYTNRQLVLCLHAFDAVIASTGGY